MDTDTMVHTLHDCHRQLKNGSSAHLVKWQDAFAGLVARRLMRSRVHGRTRSKLSRPYMDRLISLSRCTLPSTGPLLRAYSSAARTAASSRQRCFANEVSGLREAESRHFGHAVRSHVRTMRKNSRATFAQARISGESVNSSFKYRSFDSFGFMMWQTT